MGIHTPDWAKEAVFYQIFPDRFARGRESVVPPGTVFQPWGSPPEEQGFQGGDLAGIVDRLDYLEELGVTALYLNPVFASASNHRYHTYDYFQVDPLLGGNGALRKLLDAAHARGIRVILDGVFNHSGRGFWAFHHILETGPRSPYRDWFLIRRWPLRPYSSSKRRPPNYECWWNLPALPKFNIRNPGVRDYLLRVARHWIEFGADGWRLDVPEEIDDPSFWREFRDVVKGANPDAYLCGEIWHEAQEWLRGDRFDAVMNYPWNRAAYGFLARGTLRFDYEPGGYPFEPLDAGAFARRIEALHERYDPEVVFAQLNLIDSHDTARVAWTVNGDPSAVRLLVLCQMTMPGAPCVYYGDEIGMSGGPDPGCRAAFPWDDESSWDHDLLAWYRTMIGLRRRHRVLRLGRYRTLFARGETMAYERRAGDERAVIVLNAATTEAIFERGLPGIDDSAGTKWTTLYGPDLPRFPADLRIPARDGAVWIARDDPSA